MLPSPFRLAAGRARKRPAVQDARAAHDQQPQTSATGTERCSETGPQSARDSKPGTETPTAQRGAANRRPLQDVAAEPNRPSDSLPPRGSLVASDAGSWHDAAPGANFAGQTVAAIMNHSGELPAARQVTGSALSVRSPGRDGRLSAAVDRLHGHRASDGGADADARLALQSRPGTLDAFLRRESGHMTDDTPLGALPPMEEPESGPRKRLRAIDRCIHCIKASAPGAIMLDALTASWLVSRREWR
jgi:hypothetical protein